MGWQATSYALLPLAAAALSTLLVAYVWRYRQEPVARALQLLLAAIAAWSLVYAVQLGHGTVADQLFWQRLGLCIGATIPPIWLAFAIAYAGDLDWLTLGFVGLLAVDPVAFSLLTWTNDRHGLLWSSASLGSGGGLDLAFSVGYLVHITYAYLLVLVGIGLLVQLFIRSSAIYRRQAGLLVCGASVPLAANVGFTLGVDPISGLDLTTSAFAGSGLVFALALFRFDLLDLMPVARRRMIDEVGVGVLVADEDGRIVHANDTARDVLPSASQSWNSSPSGRSTRSTAWSRPYAWRGAVASSPSASRRSGTTAATGSATRYCSTTSPRTGSASSAWRSQTACYGTTSGTT